jgi:hypothetical protein
MNFLFEQHDNDKVLALLSKHDSMAKADFAPEKPL